MQAMLTSKKEYEIFKIVSPSLNENNHSENYYELSMKKLIDSTDQPIEFQNSGQLLCQDITPLLQRYMFVVKLLRRNRLHFIVRLERIHSNLRSPSADCASIKIF